MFRFQGNGLSLRPYFSVYVNSSQKSLVVVCALHRVNADFINKNTGATVQQTIYLVKLGKIISKWNGVQHFIWCRVFGVTISLILLF